MEKDVKVLKAIEALREENVIDKTQANNLWKKYITKKLQEEQEQINRLNPRHITPKITEEVRADYEK